MTGGRGVPLGRIAGIPVRLSASWFLLTAVVVAVYGRFLSREFPGLGLAAYGAALGFAVLLAASVLIHELGHGLTARAFGWRVSGINLTLMGGHTSFFATGTAPGRSAVVSLAGPLCNVILAVAGWAALRADLISGTPALVVYLATSANVLVGVFNILPGLPLDGGHALGALIWKITGSRSTGLRVAACLGFVLAAGLLAWLVVSGAWHAPYTVVVVAMLVFFLVSGARQGMASARFVDAARGLRAGDLARPAVVVRADQPLRDLPLVLGARSLDFVEVVVLDAEGTAVGVIDADAATRARGASPEVPMSAATRSVVFLPPVPATLSGEDLVRAVADHPGALRPVTELRNRAVLREPDVRVALDRRRRHRGTRDRPGRRAA